MVLFVVVMAAAGLASLVGLGSTMSPAGVTPSAEALADIPPDYLQTYQAAAGTCPGLPWTVLAGIGEAETGQGRNAQISSAGAEGPMQFEPSTFTAYDEPVPPGGANPPSPFDPVDAIYAAARLLCANGARDGANISGAIYSLQPRHHVRERGSFLCRCLLRPCPGPDRPGWDKSGRGHRHQLRRGPDRHPLSLGR